MLGSPRWSALGAALLVAALLTACTPDPTPTPTPTGFASEEEAFAAAEATYRAYIDAVNTTREDASSTPHPTDFLTGSALTAELDSEEKLEQADVSLVGPLRIGAVHRQSATASNAEISVCLDVSGTRVIDGSGKDVTPSDRGDLLGLIIDVVWANDVALVSSTTATDDAC